MANNYANLGVLAEKRGELDEAEQFYRQALECQQRSLFDPLQRGVFAPPYGGVSARCGAPVVRRTESGSHRAAMFYLWS